MVKTGERTSTALEAFTMEIAQSDGRIESEEFHRLAASGWDEEGIRTAILDLRNLLAPRDRAT